MPDANTLAVGAIYNSDNGQYSGQVRVFTWNGSMLVDLSSNSKQDPLPKRRGFFIYSQYLLLI